MNQREKFITILRNNNIVVDDNIDPLPPKQCVLKTTRIYGSIGENDEIPRKDYTTKEIGIFKSQICQKLLKLYEEQEKYIGPFVAANQNAFSSSKHADTRRQFYFSYLKTIHDSPPHIAMEEIKNLTALRKLWSDVAAKMNENFATVCRERNCFLPSMDGINCIFHQKTLPYYMCPNCRLIFPRGREHLCECVEKLNR